MGFYWSYTLLLKRPILIYLWRCMCSLPLFIVFKKQIAIKMCCCCCCCVVVVLLLLLFFLLTNQFSKVHQQERTKLKDKQEGTMEKLAQVQQKVRYFTLWCHA